MSREELKAAADRIVTMGTRQLREYHAEEHDDPEMLEIIEGHMLVATTVLAELAATADDAEPLTAERCVGMGAKRACGETEFYTAESTITWSPCGRVWLSTVGYSEVLLPGTYRTVGALRRLLEGLKGDEP